MQHDGRAHLSLDRRQVLRFAAGAAVGAACSSPVRAEDAPAAWRGAWPETDFGRAAVPFSEILSGGVHRDGIPALSVPKVVAVPEDSCLSDVEPVMAVEFAGAGALPRASALHHRIVSSGPLQRLLSSGGAHGRRPW
jgi:hypothetical protein